MTIWTPTKLGIKVPALRRTDDTGSTVHVQSVDWDRHQHYLLIRVLPTCDRIVVTSKGVQLFYVTPTLEFERVSYETTIPEHAWRHSKKPIRYVRGTEFRLYRRAILNHALKQNRPFVVTWYGWPDYQVTPIQGGRKLVYQPLWDRKQLLAAIKKRSKK